MINIELSLEEMTIAAQTGTIRRISSMLAGYNKNKHADKSDWSTDIDGAAAEMAFAKYLNVYWGASNLSFKNPDVGNWQVRSTNYTTGNLIIRRNDTDDERNYVLVITNGFKQIIVGYIKAGDAKKDKYWKGDSWWVPQRDLKSFDEVHEDA